MSKIVKFTEVYEDGRLGRVTVIARFSNEMTAKAYARGRGNYGSDAHTRKVEFTICDTIEEVELCKKDDAKAKALAKLTPEERRLLGL